ncbi:MAG: hypothetical protein LBH32_07535 [Dysgonamonadaceae bacterium]|jgi:hypothetical protein|nr:hypothetical protein [Dysgonamonadaceae bacterium]
MKKVSLFFVLCFFVLGFTGCGDNKKDDKSIFYFYNEPAIIENLGSSPVVKTPHGKFFVSFLKGDSLKAGNVLWTSFSADMGAKVKDSLTTAYKAVNFKYEKVDTSHVIMPTTNAEFEKYLSDDYSASIQKAVLHKDNIDSLLFFGFQKQNNVNKKYVYEIIMNPKTENGNPTFYIRMKETNPKIGTVFAFDMKKFIAWYRKNVAAQGPLKFNLKYKTGKGKDGKDIYSDFKSNPISWTNP